MNEMKAKSKTITVSKALRESEAKVFIESMKDLFEGKLARADQDYDDNSHGRLYPTYYVVRDDE